MNHARTVAISVTLALLAATGCKSDDKKAAPAPSKKPADKAKPKAEPKAEPVAEPKTEPVAEPAPAGEIDLEKLVKSMASGGADAVKALHAKAPAIWVVFSESGDAKVGAATCTDEALFDKTVAARAAEATELSCHGNECIHYRADDTKVAFAFRNDGTLAGLLENIETSDAAGQDDEVADMEKLLTTTCP